MTGPSGGDGIRSGLPRLVRISLVLTTSARRPVPGTPDPLERALHEALDAGAVIREASPRNFMLWYPALRRNRWQGLILLPNRDARLSPLEIAVLSGHMLQIAGVGRCPDPGHGAGASGDEVLRLALSRVRAQL
ncbi:hypothetical protein [Pannonibacter tanglangensis]|uniref:Uncharacterized protein n=1 Tax=Pannonibacter tanglangensis TaxID=2750084 RepID=A0ABW9ZIT8_9HYPH|nr:hypothetical protein [Pannonibacter sp. XCT-34]NBN64775.1 hypothetical protein [Pannonibacter sp. XCT-34]